MKNTELFEIESSVQSLVRRAYDLGRDDALKRLVEVVKTDRTYADQLALAGPPEAPPELHHEMNGAAPARGGTPWWAWPVR